MTGPTKVMLKKNMHQVIVCNATNISNVFNVTSVMIQDVTQESNNLFLFFIKKSFNRMSFKSCFYTEFSLKKHPKRKIKMHNKL